MPIDHVVSSVPAYAIWFGSIGVSAGLSGFLIGRDNSVRDSCDKACLIPLGELNEYLRQKAILPNTLVLDKGTVYDLIRDVQEFEHLSTLVAGVRRVLRAWEITQWLTRALVAGVALYAAVGLTMAFLVAKDVIGVEASEDVNVAVWGPLTVMLVVALLLKAAIFFRNSD